MDERQPVTVRVSRLSADCGNTSKRMIEFLNNVGVPARSASSKVVLEPLFYDVLLTRGAP